MKALSRNCWFVTADAGRAHAYARAVPGATYQRVESWTSDLDLPSNQQPDATDKPGRMFDSVGNHRHAAETVPPKELLKRAFGRDLARSLNKAREEGAFTALVIYAPPKFLHELRQHLDKPTTDVVVRSEAKDLTRLPEAELFGVFDNVPMLAAGFDRTRMRTAAE